MSMSIPAALITCLLLQSSSTTDNTPASHLPDTGQTTRYTQTFGEDADFTGNNPSFTDNGNGTVTDNVTGLTWQKTDGGEMTFEQAQEYASSLKLASHNDWRLPNSAELFSIMDHGRHGPAMNTQFFTRSDARYWWTNSARAGDPSKIWIVNTGGGIGAHSKLESLSAGGDRPVHVRCVRGKSPFGTGPQLQKNSDGTLTDLQTGLVWQLDANTQPMTWEDALNYCSQLRLAEHSDWRLPNIRELRSLSDDRFAEPSLDTSFLPNATANNCWSSTTQANRSSRAWFVDFRTGLVTYSEKSELLQVRAVRGGNATPGQRSKPTPAATSNSAPGNNKPPGKKPRTDQPKNNRPKRKQ